MAQHGAKHLVLTSGRGVTDPLQLGLLNDLAAKGVDVSATSTWSFDSLPMVIHCIVTCSTCFGELAMLQSR